METIVEQSGIPHTHHLKNVGLLVSPSYGVYRPRVDGLVNPEYMDLLLRTENYRVEYTRRSKGITASRLRLYPDDFLDIPFLRPPTNEQTHIVKYLRRATANVDSTIEPHPSTDCIDERVPHPPHRRRRNRSDRRPQRHGRTA